ncbi:YeeE/YedE family protein [Winogradskyella immobilis]|uniref:YeeE/YedE family protein n=1 Tax=Winogradskyella immobilis TaxID=2816852 RepID=A0ABS8EMN1_9FLAO|nr:YeeE/YedE thiosulfate transporter family protein [Winogradskyella immobilis]MCC1484456.1 YeeE/YedE family protein [Winogradskyella immobilis]MCG0016548.1 YeeE/YedE family protein [Winogradskyella immobilis]
MEYILQPWPWYISGPLIAGIMFILIYFGKTFGMSSNLKTLCAIGGASKYSDFFKFDWRAQRWNLTVVLGAVIGGFIAHHFLSSPTDINLSQQTVSDLSVLGFENAGKTLVPNEIYSCDAVLSIRGFLILIIGGFLVGFGTRYAGGCTSGHAITGLSSLQLPSLIAVIGFFIGGLIMIHLIFPILF